MTVVSSVVSCVYQRLEVPMFDVHSWLAELKRTISTPSSVRRCRRSQYSRIECLESRALLAATPIGTEFRVNTTVTNTQTFSSVATDADGDFVVAWHSNQDGVSFDVYAQRYSAAGVPQGSEFRVNTTTANTQAYPSVGMDADGDFVIT